VRESRSMHGLAMLIVAALSAGCAVTQQSDAPADTSRESERQPISGGNGTPMPPSLGIAHPAASIPQLDAGQEADVLAIALADADVVQLLAGQSFTPTGVAVWTSGSDLIGGVARVSMPNAPTLVGSWPRVTFGPDGAPIYPSSSEAYEVIGVTALNVFVDLRSRAVAQIVPDPMARMVPLDRGERLRQLADAVRYYLSGEFLNAP
jgi:hypothetical protein